MAGQNSVHEALIEAAWNRLTEAQIGLDAEASIEWPNKAFEPPTGDTGVFDQPVWAKVSLITNPGVPVTQGEEGKDEFTGILQIDLNQPKNTGDSEVRKGLGPLENYFTAGRALSKDGEDAIITSVGRIPGRVVDDRFYRMSVSVSWYARVQRQPLT